jgi:hypothetical protein
MGNFGGENPRLGPDAKMVTWLPGDADGERQHRLRTSAPGRREQYKTVSATLAGSDTMLVASSTSAERHIGAGSVVTTTCRTAWWRICRPRDQDGRRIMSLALYCADEQR